MIDFEVRRGAAAGLTVSFAPGPEHNHPLMISVSEDAYVLAELCIIADNPDYLPRGRWGLTRLSPHDAERLAVRIRKLRNSVTMAIRPEAIVFPYSPRLRRCFGQPPKRAAAEYGGEIFRRKCEAARFLNLLAEPIRRWSQRGGDVFVFGI